jgi:hypothetical protein
LDLVQEDTDLARRQFTPVMKENYRAFRTHGYSHTMALDKAHESFDNTMRAIRQVKADNDLQSAVEFAHFYPGAPAGDVTPNPDPYPARGPTQLAMDGRVVAVLRPKPADGQGMLDEAIRQMRLAADRIA